MFSTFEVDARWPRKIAILRAHVKSRLVSAFNLLWQSNHARTESAVNAHVKSRSSACVVCTRRPPTGTSALTPFSAGPHVEPDIPVVTRRGAAHGDSVGAGRITVSDCFSR